MRIIGNILFSAFFALCSITSTASAQSSPSPSPSPTPTWSIVPQGVGGASVFYKNASAKSCRYRLKYTTRNGIKDTVYFPINLFYVDNYGTFQTINSCNATLDKYGQPACRDAYLMRMISSNISIEDAMNIFLGQPFPYSVSFLQGTGFEEFNKAISADTTDQLLQLQLYSTFKINRSNQLEGSYLIYIASAHSATNPIFVSLPANQFTLEKRCEG